MRECYSIARKWREILYRRTHDTAGAPLAGMEREAHDYRLWSQVELSIKQLMAREGIDLDLPEPESK